MAAQHPWESELPHSPLWNGTLFAIPSTALPPADYPGWFEDDPEWPGEAVYLRELAQLRCLAGLDYNATAALSPSTGCAAPRRARAAAAFGHTRASRGCWFGVEDPWVNVVLARANADLLTIAKLVTADEYAPPPAPAPASSSARAPTRCRSAQLRRVQGWLDKTAAALNGDSLWDRSSNARTTPRPAAWQPRSRALVLSSASHVTSSQTPSCGARRRPATRRCSCRARRVRGRVWPVPGPALPTLLTPWLDSPAPLRSGPLAVDCQRCDGQCQPAGIQLRAYAAHTWCAAAAALRHALAAASRSSASAGV